MKGTYVRADFELSTIMDIKRWSATNKLHALQVPKMVYHTTVLYSRKPLARVFIETESLASLSVAPKSLMLLGDEGTSTKALVLVLDAPEIVELHDALISHGGTHDYPQYIPHVTVAFVPPNFDFSHIALPDFKLYLSEITTEELDLSKKLT